MPSLSETIAALVGQRRQLAAAQAAVAAHGRSAPLLVETADFGSNPGGLKMFSYRPPGLVGPAALVVVLHGCTQTAEGFAQGAGWVALARRFGFALVCPQQTAANNLNRCFNWFQPGDAARGRGEAASIRAMIGHALADGSLDPAQVYVSGLSAGGALASVMLASYPEVFAGGAIVAGLPFGAATNLQEGLAAMHRGVVRPARAWGDLVRAASSHPGPWPRICVWQGDADKTVNPINAEEIAKQWLDVQGLAAAAPQTSTIGADHRKVWATPEGRPMIETHLVRGLAHGAPLAAGGAEGCGGPGPFLIEAGVSSSLETARFWGLTGEVAIVTPPPTAAAAPPPAKVRRGLVGGLIKALTRMGRMK